MNLNSEKSVLYFGSFEKNYSRNRIIIRGLRENKVEVFLCQADGIIFFRYLRLIKNFFKFRKVVNTIIVGFAGHYDLFLAFILGKIFKKKIIFDSFTSLYETYVEDRKETKIYSAKSVAYYLIDWLNLHLADCILFDTQAHMKYFNKKFSLQKHLARVVYLGSDDKIFFPKKVKSVNDVLFYGYFQPLHGTLNIVKAAAVLPDVNFKLIGRGQDKRQVEDYVRKYNLSNVNFFSEMSLDKLKDEIDKSRIILGIFGETTKANCVIPNKVYDGLACKKPVITLNTDAANEFLKHRVNCLLINQANPLELKKAILELMISPKLRYKISANGYKLYRRQFTPQKIVSNQLKNLL